MKEMARLIGITTLFCAVSGFLLAWTNGITRAPIEKALKAELNEALKKVLPACDNDVVADAREFQDGGRKWTFYVARKNGAFAGAAVPCASDRGYGGAIEVLLGLSADGAVKGMEVLRADAETPGLGARIKEPAFRGQFTGQPSSKPSWAALTRDGGRIQGITGATISSRAVAEAVRGGLEAYERHAAELAAKPEPAAGAAAR